MASEIKQVKRRRQPSILVLCEGSKTEPNYIGALVREFGLTAVSVPRNHDTDPLCLVQNAIDALRKDREIAKAYVIFDRDTHVNFDRAVQIAAQSQFFGDRLVVIKSFPSFEVWLILHFEFCRAPLSSDDALSRLRKLFPDYKKENVQCMDQFINRLHQAVENARRGLADAHKTAEMNSSTEMHLLVADFIGLSSSI